MTDRIQAEPPTPNRTPGWVWLAVLIPVLGFLVCAGLFAVFVALLTFSPTSPPGPPAVPAVPIERPADR